MNKYTYIILIFVFIIIVISFLSPYHFASILIYCLSNKATISSFRNLNSKRRFEFQWN